MRTAEQHRNDVLASNILYGSLAVSFLLSVMGLFIADAPPGTRSPMFGLLLLVHSVEAGLYYAIRVGKPWAKILLLLLVGLSAISTVLPLLSGDQEALNQLREDTWGAVKEVIAFTADIVALVLLFRRPPVQSGPFSG
jgi:hypothetical protein